MTITLMTNNSEPNRIGKTPTTIRSINGTLKNATDIVNPTITIVNPNVVFNYVEIPTFNRFYFVSNITHLTNDLISIDLHVDVLDSFINSIKNASIVANRSSSKFYQYVADSFQLTSNKPQIVYKNFDRSPFNSATITADDKCIIVRGNFSRVEGDNNAD